ncbi:ABC transporter ATP-binding protein, partial [Staphylococcus warneri]
KSGQIFLQDKLLNQYSQKALAQRLATVHQKSKVPEDFTVRQVIETGRYSYQRLFKKDLRKDSVVNTVIQQLDLTQFEHQSVMNLSGGELQRVFIGMALAQEPQYLLL